MTTSVHLVVGAGPIGSSTARQLVAAGQRVRLVTRSGSGPELPGIERVRADAADAAVMAELAEGAAALYNCVNPAYHRWPTDWPPIAAALLQAAERSGAVLATVSNLYGYGPVDGPITPDLPLAATGRKGQVRARMWTEALAAQQAGRARVTEVRGSDYVGPGAESHLGERVIPRVIAGRGVRMIGRTDQPHSWTYTEDVARLLVTVAADERAWGRAWHVPSPPPRTQQQAVDDLADLAGVARVRVGTLSPALLRLVGLFSPTVRELQETRYQFERPFVLDDSQTRAVFGLAPTPWASVLTAALESYGAPAAGSLRTPAQ